ncbi:hypothetical protein L504_2144 [Bordetella bronchiseptica F2]|nr:hypothetical protein L542_2117 [Bordetella bronchiseptica F-1]KDC29257.1 hypothetical protein L504_2144 [Bordetella bronchiseptica F2]
MQKESLQATERERTLLTRVKDLEDEIGGLKKRLADRERYELVEEYPGTFTLRLKEASRNGEPMHHLCPSCMDNKAVKSILQFNQKEKRFGNCPECKQGYRFIEDPPVQPPRRGGYWNT